MITLTPRERQVLVKVAIGKTNAEIARGLHIHRQTVKNEVSSLLAKLRCRNRVQLVLMAIYGAIPLEQTMEMFVESNVITPAES